MGTVEPDKHADLVILEANPLADIANTRRIKAVVHRGQLDPPERLINLVRGESNT